MTDANTTYRCRACGQLLPFDDHGCVPEACQRRCQGRCDWDLVGATTQGLIAAASHHGPVGPDGLPERAHLAVP